MSIAEKLQTIAENEQRVYEAGKKSEYDRFWETHLEKNSIGEFEFAGLGWDDETFNPPRGTVIQPTNARYMFARSAITDLATLCEKNDTTIDFSKAISIQYAFYDSYITKVGVVDATSSNSVNSVFYNSTKLHTIVKLVLKEDGSQSFTTPFRSCSALENMEIGGVIGKNGFDVSPCTKLTHDSLMSILNAGRNCTLNLGTANLEKLSVEEKAVAIEKGCTLI
jgi:hypothetical protein